MYKSIWNPDKADQDEIKIRLRELNGDSVADEENADKEPFTAYDPNRDSEIELQGLITRFQRLHEECRPVTKEAIEIAEANARAREKQFEDAFNQLVNPDASDILALRIALTMGRDIDEFIQKRRELQISKTCILIEQFDLIRDKLRDIGEPREHAHAFSQCMQLILYPPEGVFDAYQQFCALDAAYGKHAKFADLNEEDQERVLGMMR